ncbi:hypothetical protein BDW22DRAFT_1425126 [Trametopsis cervina]|nr:hypothetical protein BDW22DRAFT_1425126 [Trametopsis cervina]
MEGDHSTELPPASQTDGSFPNILTPGSSLHPSLLLILDGAFGLLLCVFLGLLVLTKGSVHIFALIGIEGCLWASVKWVVSELKKLPETAEGTDSNKTKDE